MKTRVLVVDDSALMRSILCELINAAPDLEVVGTAGSAQAAREAIKQLSPDVLTLDVEMPGMDGLEFLDRLMRLRPMPVIMISALTDKGSETSLRALELGAVDVISKPRVEPVAGMQRYADEICDKIRAARLSRPRVMPRADPMPNRNGTAHVASGGAAKAGAANPPPSNLPQLDARTLAEKYIYIGASTGGTEAIKEVLTQLPASMPPILIVQHMPEMFTGSFARRLDSLCRIRVKEAEDGERIQPGTAYLAPGHSHLRLRRTAAGAVCELSRDEPVNRHRPSVDVLFESAARWSGSQALGVILTGMGKDGARGMLAMRQAGAWNIAQDEESCVVWGMPREAALIGAAQEVAALRDIPTRLLARLKGEGRGSNM
ncbi:protein-glutamate methylesterase/protein-glutamine glutaminase [Uliginosibacterium sp. H1]|uniref:protein-glutamate methylesterase/protein-glutamine glutaminase n=1 Tax=Uliginosibacterium sp. H1 TaxID=3114757 RepID=UPI002E1738E2|nr:chemotaxis response regulator protein-glutamate methylesterase [Uliginosibacterium sp. H1]